MADFYLCKDGRSFPNLISRAGPVVGSACAPSWSLLTFVCLLEWILSVPGNSYGHVGTLPPLNWTFTQNEDVKTSTKCFKYV